MSESEQSSASPNVEQKHVKPVIPEGMSKSAWKKEQKRLRFAERKSEYQQIRKEKKARARENRRAKIQEYVEKGQEVPDELKQRRKQRMPEDQSDSGLKFVIDCDFDDLMTEKERVSLSAQITRSYSSNRFAKQTAECTVSSFNKLLKKRFEEGLKDANWANWDHFTFQEEEFKPEDKEKCIYLSSDSTEVLETLEPGMTYVIGGIVDKGRYKNLCKDKAEKMGLVTKRLPIDEYIKLSGRRVLTTTHVVELMLKWMEVKDWRLAFNSVLPPRKLIRDREEHELPGWTGDKTQEGNDEDEDEDEN
ncbi:CYFA0S20e00540g1_1 [Cyberlindnera fabianii]|uniref:tRNA (guanine(9)-N1)-methyltransferase n=1 Tax=Cyberlindnera fabianii TaxID=36022 RepID=A0A061B7D3_CYBFA|nr:tRNA (guanine(9)-N1)-methyltransferase [Cyberlindnera fabianii]CDR45818.1 CYFA0S20e00540g1_1 [Cyberlindnera fabianii]